MFLMAASFDGPRPLLVACHWQFCSLANKLRSFVRLNRPSWHHISHNVLLCSKGHCHSVLLYYIFTWELTVLVCNVMVCNWWIRIRIQSSLKINWLFLNSRLSYSFQKYHSSVTLWVSLNPPTDKPTHGLHRPRHNHDGHMAEITANWIWRSYCMHQRHDPW